MLTGRPPPASYSASRPAEWTSMPRRRPRRRLGSRCMAARSRAGSWSLARSRYRAVRAYADWRIRGTASRTAARLLEASKARSSPRASVAEAPLQAQWGWPCPDLRLRRREGRRGRRTRRMEIEGRFLPGITGLLKTQRGVPPSGGPPLFRSVKELTLILGHRYKVLGASVVFT